MIIKFNGETTTYPVRFQVVSDNLVSVSGDFEPKETGFIISRDDRDDNWDYSEYTTIYERNGNVTFFSKDGSVKEIPETVINATFDGSADEPESIKVKATVNGKAKTYTLTKDTGWQASLGRVEIETFSLEAQEVEEYEKRINGTTVEYFNENTIPSFEERLKNVEVQSNDTVDAVDVIMTEIIPGIMGE